MATSSRAGITYPDQSDNANMEASMLEMITSAERFVVSKHTSTTTRDTAIPSPVNGDVCYITDTAAGANNRALNVYNGSAWKAIYAAPLFAYKTATESVTSSTTLQSDDHLTVTLDTNATYWMQVWLAMTGSDAGDFKYEFTYPANCSVANGTVSYSTASTGAAPVVSALSNAGLDASTPTTTLTAGTIAGVTSNLIISGMLTVGSTAGSLLLRWAQNTSDGTATQLQIGSNMMLIRVV